MSAWPFRAAARIAETRRQAHLAFENAAQQARQFDLRRRLRNESGNAERDRAADDPGIVMRRHDHERAARRRGPHPVGSEQARGSRHRQIEQDQIEAVARGDHVERAIDRGRLQHLGVGKLGPDHADQGGTEQRVVLDDQQSRRTRLIERRLVRQGRGRGQCCAVLPRIADDSHCSDDVISKPGGSL
ncbi:hypothetical protein ACVWY2_006885 [Bradyrhizobium sp. JR6.1]